MQNSKKQLKLKAKDEERSCKRKGTHADAAYALIACLEAYRQAGHDVFPYKCRHCPGYHIGRNPRNVREFIAALIDFTPVSGRPPLRLTTPLAIAMTKAGIKRELS